MDDWYITCYNLIFTAFPLCITSLTDIDVKEEDSEECKKLMPLLYKESRDSKKAFTLFRFIAIVSKSIILSCIIFVLSSTNTIIDLKGNFSNIWYMSLKNYSCILIAVTINLFIGTNFIAYFLPLIVFITTFLFFIAFLFLVHFGLIFEFNSKASISGSISNINFYLVLLGINSLNGVLDYSLKVYKIFFEKSLNSKLELKRAMMTLEEDKRNEMSREYSFNRKDSKKENKRKSFFDPKIYKENIDSYLQNSIMKIKSSEKSELYELNDLNHKKFLNENNYNISRNISSESSSINKSNMSNKHILNRRNIYNVSVMENNNKSSEKIKLNVNKYKDSIYNKFNYNFSKRFNDKINNGESNHNINIVNFNH
jgi:hypothetical protein